MTELATRNLIAGTARLMSAVIVLLELVVGVALGERARARARPRAIRRSPGRCPSGANWIALVACVARRRGRSCRRRSRAFGWIVAACVVGYVGSRSARRGSARSWACSSVRSRSACCRTSTRACSIARRRSSQVPAVLLLVPGSMGFRGMASLLDKRHADRRRDRCSRCSSSRSRSSRACSSRTRWCRRAAALALQTIRYGSASRLP